MRISVCVCVCGIINVKLALTNCQNAKRKMFAQDQRSYSGFPLFVLSGKSENSKIFPQPTDTHTYTHTHAQTGAQRENNGERIYFFTNKNSEYNAKTGGGTVCLASKNIFIDIFALFKCRIFHPSKPQTLGFSSELLHLAKKLS